MSTEGQTGLEPAVVAAVLHDVAGRAELALGVVQAHGRPHATAARLADLDARGCTWRVTEDGGESDLTTAWRTRPSLDEPGLLAAVETLHAAATSSLRWSLAMGEHGMLRYSGPLTDLDPR